MNTSVASNCSYCCVLVTQNRTISAHFVEPPVAPPPATVVATGTESRRCPCRVFQVCGSPDIPLHLLKSVATYKGVEPTAPLIQWFWEVMESFSNTERSLFLRFVWGRTRLPRTIADFRGRDFVVQVSVLHHDNTSIKQLYSSGTVTLFMFLFTCTDEDTAMIVSVSLLAV